MGRLVRLTGRVIEDPVEIAAAIADLERRQRAAAKAAAAENDRVNGNAGSMNKRQSGKAKKRN